MTPERDPIRQPLPARRDRLVADLYRAWTQWRNFFQPVMRLSEKTRIGSKVHRRYDQTATPAYSLWCCNRSAVRIRVASCIHLVEHYRNVLYALDEASLQPKHVVAVLQNFEAAMKRWR